MLVLIGFIGFFSTNGNVINLAFGEKFGEQDGGFQFDHKATTSIKWSFQSTQPVKLTIYRTSTLEWLESVCAEMQKEFPGSYFGYIINDFLKDSVVSSGLLEDLGIYNCSNNQDDYTIIISTSGHLNYQFKFDPYSIDLLAISCGLLFFTTFIAIIYYFSKINKQVKFNKTISHKRLNQKEVQKSKNSSDILYCAQCGVQCEQDSKFCHECGHKFNQVELLNNEIGK